MRVRLGQWPSVKAVQARAEAQKILGDMARGIDPVAAKREAKAAGCTLRTAIEEYLKDPLGRLKDST